MAIEDTDEHVKATPREIDLHAQLDALHNQVTELLKAWETITEGPKLLSEVQNLKATLGTHSKQLEQSAEKLSQIEVEYLVIRDENEALDTTGKKRCIFQTQHKQGYAHLAVSFEGGP
ncbi:hypothetical protein F2Q68_00034494 [Brassica cretica]|uniref:Uncharacterized protein n=1 Tax=Brassica cretica TaxID=69181 RepID=A0A8S9H1X7_BRACR|nr:hypothetical protein F2Q68_00034494 [Brassica cretica]